MATDTDGDRWGEAQSLLDRTPTEPAARRLRRAQRNRWLLILGLAVSGTALMIGVAFLLRDGPAPDPGGEVSTTRAVAGYSLSGLGVLLMVVGLFWQIRAVRRARGYSSPLHVLTRRQRKELLAQVRGRSPAQPEHVGLARHLAELVQAQQSILVPQAGGLVNFIGLWIAAPSTWNFVSLLVLFPVLLLTAVLLRRESRRAQRFLDAGPAPRDDSAA